MQIFFEANTADFAKRKRVARACKTCQKRKKRCHHVFKDQEEEADPSIPTLIHKEPIRFYGDMHPESLLKDLSTRPVGEPRACSVGIIVDPALQNESNIALDGDDRRAGIISERYSKIPRGLRTLSQPEKMYLQAMGAFRTLPRETQDVLVTTWFSCLDGVLPILDGAKFLNDYASGSASSFLILAICLITCKTEEALAYLKFSEDGPLMSPIAFSRSLHVGLDAAMKADLEPDRLTKIQILGIMSLHNDGPNGVEDSSWHLAHAVQDANTLAIHIHTPGRRNNDQQSYTWWCLWVLDKINACIAGRSIMIADRDIGMGRPPIRDPTGFKNKSILIWLALSDLLAEVINLYRPTSDQSSTGWETPFPSFDDLASPFNISSLQASEQKILEIYYNVIAILSCRSGDSTTPSYTRRLLAGDRIQALMSKGYLEHVPPFPLVPYAVSLSLTVAYRVIRDSPTPTSSTSLTFARQNLTIRCEILESLSPRYWPADAMAKLGRKALLSLNNPNPKLGGGISQQLDREVSICKPMEDSGYRPELNGQSLRQKSHTHNQPKPQPLPQTQIFSNGNDNNALHLLSTAAATYDQSHSHSHAPTLASPDFTDSALGSASTPSSGLPFQDLDMLFDDFFDLSMPTFFQDPLFDGAAFDFGAFGLSGGEGEGVVGRSGVEEAFLP